MATLYIDRRDSELHLQGGRLEVRIGGELCKGIPLTLLERVVVLRRLDTDTGTLARLASHGIPVEIIHGRKPVALASVIGAPCNDARRRLAQYAAWHDPDNHRQLVRQLLQIKLWAQLRLVNQWLRKRPDRRRPLKHARHTLHERYAHLRVEDADISTLRGIEGAAAVAGFQALAAVLPPALGFDRRRRRPPPDPVNALLSLGYTLGAGLSLEAAHAAGLDPAIGYLHEPSHDRPSLALDLLEPLRPRIEALVQEILASRRLEEEHFTHRQGGCQLGKAGRTIFYSAWEERAPVWRRWLRHLTQELVRSLQDMHPYPREDGTGHPA